MAFCSKCGYKNSTDASFCEDCGHPLATETLSATLPANPSAPSPRQAITAKKHAGARKTVVKILGLAALTLLGAGTYVLLAEQPVGYLQSRSDSFFGEIRGALSGSALPTGADAASAVREYAAKKGDLTRESAAVLLNKHLPMDQIKYLEFRGNEGLAAAQKDGLLSNTHECLWFPNLRFTRKLELILGDMAQGQCVTETDMGRNRRILLRKSLQVRFKQVTGITDGPQPGSKVVEYETEYIFPPRMDELKPYVFLGMRHESTFKKYDDGWRTNK